MNMILWQMLAGTLGGYNRGSILKCLIDKPYNVNQLAETLDLDYETIRYHLQILAKNGIINASEGGKSGKIYFLTEKMESHLNGFNHIWNTINLRAARRRISTG